MQRKLWAIVLAMVVLAGFASPVHASGNTTGTASAAKASCETVQPSIYGYQSLILATTKPQYLPALADRRYVTELQTLRLRREFVYYYKSPFLWRAGKGFTDFVWAQTTVYDRKTSRKVICVSWRGIIS